MVEAFLDMMPSSVCSLTQLSAASRRIREEAGKTSADPEIVQVTMYALTLSETMIGNCESTGVPNAGISVLCVH